MVRVKSNYYKGPISRTKIQPTWHNPKAIIHFKFPIKRLPMRFENEKECCPIYNAKSHSIIIIEENKEQKQLRVHKYDIINEVSTTICDIDISSLSDVTLTFDTFINPQKNDTLYIIPLSLKTVEYTYYEVEITKQNYKVLKIDDITNFSNSK